MAQVNELVNGQPAELIATTKFTGRVWRVVDAKTGEIVAEAKTYAEAMQGMADWYNRQSAPVGRRIV